MKQLVATLISWGPMGMFVAAFLDGAGATLPGGVDVLLVFLSTRMPEQVIWLAGLATVGSALGTLVLFWLARRGGQMFLEKRSKGKVARFFRSWFDRYGLLTVFISAMVPLPIMPMKIIVICAGAMGANPGAFITTFLGGRIPRYLGLALLGRAMGENAIEYLRQHVWHLTGFAVLLFALIAVLIRIADYRRARSAYVKLP